MKKIITHGGSFHPDDIFAVAALEIFLGGEVEVIRARDPKVIEGGDYVVDVGGKSDGQKFFDHHQEDGAGERDGVPFASFGLVWNKFGEKICNSKEIALAIDARLVKPIDATDNGEGKLLEILPGVLPYDINEIIEVFNLTSDEDEDKDADRDEIFLKAVEFAEKVIRREIKWEASRFEAKQIVGRSYCEAIDKRIIVLDRDCPYEDIIVSYTEPLFVVHKCSDGPWSAETVRLTPRQFGSKILFPEEWAGKRDGELQKITGVSDAVFCHNKRFTAIAKSKEGAMNLAKLALRNL